MVSEGYTVLPTSIFGRDRLDWATWATELFAGAGPGVGLVTYSLSTW